jgi:hypothetical protein
VSGTVLQVATSTDRLHTIDVEINKFFLSDNEIPLTGTRFIRIEVFPTVRIAKHELPSRGLAVQICGQLMWDGDGWLEIHPRTLSDVRW